MKKIIGWCIVQPMDKERSGQVLKEVFLFPARQIDRLSDKAGLIPTILLCEVPIIALVVIGAATQNKGLIIAGFGVGAFEAFCLMLAKIL